MRPTRPILLEVVRQRNVESINHTRPRARAPMMYNRGSANREVKFSLRCFSKSAPGPHKYVIDKKTRELKGNKVCLPPEVLGQLQIRFRHSMPSPLLFRVSNDKYGKVSHCGLVEFTAPRMCAILSDSLMEDMLLQGGDTMAFTLKELPKLTYVKFQPFRWQFSLIKNPKLVLTRELQDNYVTLTKGDVLYITADDGKRYRLTCVEVKGSNNKKEITAGCILNTDLTVEFKEPVEKAPESTQITINVPVSGFTIPHKHVYFRVKVVDPYIGVKVFGTSLQKEPITLGLVPVGGTAGIMSPYSLKLMNSVCVSLRVTERVKFVLNVSEDAKGRRLGGLSLSKRGKCDDVDDDDVDAAWGAHTESDANTSDKKSKAGAKVAGKAAGKGGSDDAEEKADEIRRRRLAALSRW
eukprot:jgi/Bigna1/79330/fgenesh1_pg.61_\